jgi:hypothetical protein
MAPRQLDIFLNRPNIVDFSEAESFRPQLEFALSEGETGVTEYPVRVAAFTSVHSLSLFFVGVLFTSARRLFFIFFHNQKNPENSSSRVYFIGFRGDMRSVKREGTSKLPVVASNAADAPLGTKAETKASNRPTAR